MLWLLVRSCANSKFLLVRSCINSMLYLCSVPTAFNYSYDGAAEKSCAKIQAIKQTKKFPNVTGI